MVTEYFDKDPSLFLIILLSAIGYWVASGAARADYKLLHVALGVSLFFSFGFGVYYIIGLCFEIYVFWKIIFAGIVIIFIAYFWRRWWSTQLSTFLRKQGITTRNFGPSRTWDTIISIPKRKFYRYHVELKCGMRLISDTQKLVNEGKVDCSPAMISDEEGNVALIVTEIFRENDVESTSVDYIDEKGILDYTYIPVSNIKTIKAGYKTKRCIE